MNHMKATLSVLIIRGILDHVVAGVQGGLWRGTTDAESLDTSGR